MVTGNMRNFLVLVFLSVAAFLCAKEISVYVYDKDLETPLEGVKIISCPTCGRTDTTINLEEIAQTVDSALSAQFDDVLREKKRRLVVAVMGCEVNGPGEASHANLGIAGARNGDFLLFIDGKILKKIHSADVVKELVYHANELIKTW